ncbi:MAG: hypothetical protein JMDDDDMK_04018 [Acidobacteria bacterium]|nr:hypothetical protein [Acidobacteriota bacterium]
MTAYRTNHLYETNLMSNSAADTAPRMMTRKDAPTMCMVCREEVKMIAAEKAATICQCSRRIIYRWIEEGGLHFTEMPDGEVLICGRSLSKKMDELDSTTDRLPRRNSANK